MVATGTDARRRVAWIAAVAVALAVVGGCGGGQPAATPSAAPTETSEAADESAEDSAEETAEPTSEGALAVPAQADGAFTYNPALAPEGATMTADVESTAATTSVTLEVEGLLPDRGYAAHVHANPCGPTGDAAGPHFQNNVDPAAGPGKPSTDPAYANPQNEMWLDLRTDGEGNGEATAEVPFGFTDRVPASIILHEAPATATEPGKAGTAGARLACLDVDFR